MSTPLNVLLAASDPDVLRALIAEFPRGDTWLPMAARAQSQVARVIGARPPQVALVHATLDDTTGRDFCVWLGQQCPGVVRILLTDALPTPPGPGDPYEATMRHPAPPGLLADEAIAELRRQHARAGMERFMVDVRHRASLMDSQDYFDILGLGDEVTEFDIQRAYDQLSLRFHPDRHLELRQHPDYRLLFDLYKRIGEAYRVLTDPEKRERYLDQLDAGSLRYDDTVREKSGPKLLEDLSEVPNSKKFLRLAQQSLATGDFKSALQNLKFALSMDGGNEALKAKVAEIQQLV